MVNGHDNDFDYNNDDDVGGFNNDYDNDDDDPRLAL